MDKVLMFIVLAVTVEGIVEYARTLIEHESAKTVVLQLAALAVAIFLCCITGADIYAALGVSFGSLPIVGSILTGVFASRGANYASDILSKLQKSIA